MSDKSPPEEVMPASRRGASDDSSRLDSRLDYLRDDPVCGPLLAGLDAMEFDEETPDPDAPPEILAADPNLVATGGQNNASAHVPAAGVRGGAGSTLEDAGPVVIKSSPPPADPEDAAADDTIVEPVVALPPARKDAPTLVDIRRVAPDLAESLPVERRSWLVYVGAMLVLGAALFVAYLATDTSGTDTSGVAQPGDSPRRHGGTEEVGPSLSAPAPAASSSPAARPSTTPPPPPIPSVEPPAPASAEPAPRPAPPPRPPPPAAPEPSAVIPPPSPAPNPVQTPSPSGPKPIPYLP